MDETLAAVIADERGCVLLVRKRGELAWADPGNPGELNIAPLSRRHILPALVARRETAA